jgi:hypothetical protein
MALPFSGPLSINDIRNELGVSTGSLRELSALAGFSTPDSISEFYGYSPTLNSYNYSIIAYYGYTAVEGTYTYPSGGTISFYMYNDSPSGGIVGYVCARENSVIITSGNGTFSKGAICF